VQANALDASNAIYYIHITCPAPTPTSPAPDCFAFQWYLGNTSLPFYDNTTLGAAGTNSGRKLMGRDDVKETQLVSMIRGSGLKQPGHVALAVTAALWDVPEALSAETHNATSANINRRRLLGEDLSMPGPYNSTRRQLLFHACGATCTNSRRRSSRRRLDENGRPLPLTLKELAAESAVDLSDPVQFSHFLHKHRWVLHLVCKLTDPSLSSTGIVSARVPARHISSTMSIVVCAREAVMCGMMSVTRARGPEIGTATGVLSSCIGWQRSTRRKAGLTLWWF
jgi:hypothetical protein